MRLLLTLFATCGLLAMACSDAKPGSAPAGSGGSAAGGATGTGGAGLGAGGGGAQGGEGGAAPDFTSATALPVMPTVSAPDSFGGAVAISDVTLVVGARNDLDVASQSGALHVFVREGPSWILQNKLKEMTPASGDFFGWSVAIDGDVAAAGARGRGNPQAAGSAFGLTRNGTSWVAQQELRDDPPQTNGELGRAVAVAGDWLLASAPMGQEGGKVLFFNRTGSNWMPAGETLAKQTQQRFGYALAVDGDTALIGAPGFDIAGTVYVFVRQGGSWMQQDELVAGDGGGLNFGRAVALSGNTAVVGNGRLVDTDFNGTALGGAYVFTRSAGSWTQQAQLLPDDGAPGNHFGIAVAVSGNAALVGASHDQEAGSSAGAAYVFTRSGGSWSQQTKLLRPGGGADERFGFSVALAGKTAAVGALTYNTNQGSVTVFEAQ